MRILFLLYLVTFSLFSAVGQIHKTYEGSFPNTISFIGQAPDEIVKYSYYIDENTDERVFDGHFTLSSAKHSKTVQGDFKDNKQDGVWTYEQDYKANLFGERVDWIYNVTVNFTNGILNGPLHYESLYDPTAKRTGHSQKKYDFTLNNGKIVGPFSGSEVDYSNSSILRSTVWKGEFDDKGNPIGKWRKEELISTTIYTFTPNSPTYEIKVIDERTGDITKSTEKISSLPIDMHFILSSLSIQNFFLRDTKGVPQEKREDTTIYDKVTTLAEPKISIDNFVKENSQVHEMGRCVLRVTVNSDGSAYDPLIVKGVSRELDREAVRLFNKMAEKYGDGLFVPGTIHGKPVNSHATITFKFR